MKLSCTQENLNQGLFVVGHVAGKNTNLPILNNILLQAEGGALKLSTTNLEIGISCVVRAKIEEEGEFTVQSKILSDYISLLPKEKVDMGVEDQELKVSCKNYNTKIKGLSASDFPLIPKIDKNNPYICSAGTFRQALSQVIFAVSTNETRPEIGGVLFNFSGNGLTMAATDSYRLAEKKINISGPDEEKKIIVPAKTLQELLRILSGFKKGEVLEDETDDNIEIYLGENQILFVYDNMELISRLIEGQYPDYEQIIPTEQKTKARVGVNVLAKAVKTASLFSRSGIYDVNVEFKPGENKIIISSVNNQLGENTAEVDVEAEGDSNSTVLNFRYLLDGLNAISDGDIALETLSSENPCVIKPTDEDNYLYIVMPIKR